MQKALKSSVPGIILTAMNSEKGGHSRFCQDLRNTGAIGKNVDPPITSPLKVNIGQAFG